MSRTLRIFSLTFLFLACFVAIPVPEVSAQETDEESMGERFGAIPIPEGLTKEDIRDAIAEVVPVRGWIVKQKSDRRVVAFLNHRGREATVTLLFGGEQVEIFCEGWTVDRAGNRKKPDTPAGWLENLSKDLTRKFATLTVPR